MFLRVTAGIMVRIIKTRSVDWKRKRKKTSRKERYFVIFCLVPRAEIQACLVNVART